MKLNKSTVSAALLSLLAIGSQATAATSTWSGPNNSAWTTPGFWTGGVLPTFNNQLDVTYASGALANSGGVDHTLRSFTFSANGANAFSLSNAGNGGGAGRNMNFSSDTGTATLQVNSGVSGSKSIGRATTTSGNSAGTITLTSNLNIIHNGSGTLSIGKNAAGVDDRANIVGAGGITKTGSGTLIIEGVNTYSGTTAINNAVVNIRNSSALGSTSAGTSVASGATLQVQDGISVGAEALSLNGTGASSNGALRNMSGSNSWAGAITLASAASVGSDAGTLTLSGGVVNGGNLFTVQGAGDTSVTTTGISGAGGLTKNGIGILSVSTVNTYTGDTTVNAGTFNLASAGELRLGIGADGINNTIGGTGTINLDGTLRFDLTTAATANGSSWQIIDVASLSETFQSNFNVLSTIGSFTNSGGIWSITENSTTYQFSQATGLLTAVPEPSSFALFGAGLVGLALRRRRNA